MQTEVYLKDRNTYLHSRQKPPEFLHYACRGARLWDPEATTVMEQRHTNHYSIFTTSSEKLVQLCISTLQPNYLAMTHEHKRDEFAYRNNESPADGRAVLQQIHARH